MDVSLPELVHDAASHECTQKKAPRKIDQLPKEIGVLLMAAGITNGMLPPPPGPFDMIIVLSGGVVLWPRGFRILEGWAQRRFPKAHDLSMSFLDRFLDDLERRYPESTQGKARAGSDE